jgi:G3E family GTPase
MAEVTPVTVLSAGPGASVWLNALFDEPAFKTSAVLWGRRDRPPGGHPVVLPIPNLRTLFPAGGCPCCAGRGDVAHLLRTLLSRARRGDVTQVYIVLDHTTDVPPIIAALLSDPVAAAAYRLFGIAVHVNTASLRESFAFGPIMRRNLAIADRMIVAGSDDRLASFSPAAAIISEVPREAYRAVSSPWPDLAAPDLGQLDSSSEQQDASGTVVCIHSISVCPTLTKTRIMAWLAELADRHGRQILRMRGMLPDPASDKVFWIEGAGRIVANPMAVDAGGSILRRQGRVVFAVTDLRRDALAAGIQCGGN